MRWQFRNIQRVSQLPAFLPPSRTHLSAYVDRYTTSQIRKRKSRLTVSAIGRSQYREQGLILVNRKRLSIGKRPTLWGKVKGNHSEFGKKWCAHLNILLFCTLSLKFL